jgi:hypothetical protein
MLDVAAKSVDASNAIMQGRLQLEAVYGVRVGGIASKGSKLVFEERLSPWLLLRSSN